MRGALTLLAALLLAASLAISFTAPSGGWDFLSAGLSGAAAVAGFTALALDRRGRR